MNLNDLKKIINGKNERVIFVENGEPTLVVMPFNEYQKILGNSYLDEYFEDDNEKEETVSDWQAPFETEDFQDFFESNQEEIKQEKPSEQVIKPEIKVETQPLKTENNLKEDLLDSKAELTLEDLPF